MTKSPDAFRTISEVADWLGIQAHVLRFWESKFTQVKPVKRAGGRRYYRPADMLLLGGIKRLLHDEGLTIKGVQKVLREEGMSHVAGLSEPLDDLTVSELDDTVEARVQPTEPAPAPTEESGVVLPFEAAAPSGDQVKDGAQALEPEELTERSTVQDSLVPAASEPQDQAVADAPPAAASVDTAKEKPQVSAPDEQGTEAEAPSAEAAAPEPEFTKQESAAQDAAPTRDTTTPTAAQPLPAFLRKPMSEPDTRPSDNTPSDPPEVGQVPEASPPEILAHTPEPEPTDVPSEDVAPEHVAEQERSASASAETASEAAAAETDTNGPAQVDPESATGQPEPAAMEQEPNAPETEPEASADVADPQPAEQALEPTKPEPAAAAPESELEPTPAPKPRIIDVQTTVEEDIDAAPGLLTASHARRRLSAERAAQVKPLLDELTALRDKMASGRRPGAGPAARG